ncbi:hypothetical protein [Natronomonas marina]|jgi:hypothetical protein|uniref:hypothetical protein n=1 Tax=Natronomonas marina TaxID=2961939 RepID=UPI0020C95CE0|nr:hypothetical protein [Natronomonas marina]
MSTEPASTHDSHATRTTEIAARSRTDPWAATDERRTPTASAPRQFEPYSLARMCNLIDDENAYCE